MTGYGIDYGVITAFIMALSELMKRTRMDKKLIPVINIMLGIIFCFIFVNNGWKDVLFYGFMSGLTASGLYSSVKNTAQFFNENDTK